MRGEGWLGVGVAGGLLDRLVTHGDRSASQPVSLEPPNGLSCVFQRNLITLGRSCGHVLLPARAKRPHRYRDSGAS